MFTCSGALPKISHPIYRQLAAFQVVLDKQAEVQIDYDVILQKRSKEIQKVIAQKKCWLHYSSKV